VSEGRDERPVRVAIVYSSPAERDVISQVGAMLARFGVGHDETVLSPHRSPRALADWCAELSPRGVQVVVAGGGQVGALAGAVAAYTTLPVIGLPLRGGPAGGLDALVTMTSMAAGVPVACVGVEHATNAAVLAVQILAVGDPQLRPRLAEFKDAFEKSAGWP
jgi:5-(carboxyamino)imidazole ribonucleotide mutase